MRVYSERKWTFIVLLSFLFVLLSAVGHVAIAQVTIVMVEETAIERATAQRAIAERFMEEHPHIRIEFVSSGGVSPTNMMYTMYAAGVAPDIGFMDPWVALEFARQGMIIDLTPFLEREPEYFADIPKSLFDMTTIDGKVYGIPIEIQAGTIFYNQQAFDEVGLAYPDPTSWTYDDLRDYARRTTLVGSDGTVLRHGFRIPTTRNWVPAVWARGGDIVDDWNNPTGFTTDPRPIIETFEYYGDMLNSNIIQGWDRRSATYTTRDFVDRKVVMVQGNTFSLAWFHAHADFAWDVLPLPRGPEGRIGAYLNAHQSFIFSTSKHKEEAWQVLRYFASYDSLAERTRMVGTMPIRISVIRDEWLELPGVPGRHNLLEDLPLGRSPWTLPMNLWDAFGAEAESALFGRQPPTVAVEKMERQFNAALREYRAYYGLDD